MLLEHMLDVKHYLFLLLFIIISCSPSHKDGNPAVVCINNNKDIIDSINNYYLRYGLDSAVIEYCRSYDADYFIYCYSKGVLSIKSEHTSFNILISDKNIINKFVRYIDCFFIANTQRIEFERSKSSSYIIADYPWLRFDLFIGNKQKHEVIQIGEEQYDIEYNPLFLDFYYFLNDLVNSKRSFVE